MPIIKKPEDLDTNYIVELCHHKIFKEIKLKSIASRRFEDIKLSHDEQTIILVDKMQKDLISVVTGEFIRVKKTTYLEIKGTYSKNIRNGDLTYLFEILIYELDYKLISDKEHTSPGSKEFWQSLIRRNKFSIYRIDIKTNNKKIVKNYKEQNIWKYYSQSVDDIYLNDFEEFIIENKFSNLEENNILDFQDEFKIDDFRISKFKKTSDLINYENIRLVAQKIRKLK